MSTSDTGNSHFVKITPDSLSLEEVTEFVKDPSAGGISVFIGTTRDHFQGMTVMQLEYEAYVKMAMNQMVQICDQAREKWPICKIALVHRIGVVPVLEPSVIVAASAEHRKEAIDAVSFAIDSIKSTATIWKKEKYSEGREEWKVNKECAWLADNSSFS